jgi:hypothetical protein
VQSTPGSTIAMDAKVSNRAFVGLFYWISIACCDSVPLKKCTWPHLERYRRGVNSPPGPFLLRDLILHTRPLPSTFHIIYHIFFPLLSLAPCHRNREPPPIYASSQLVTWAIVPNLCLITPWSTSPIDFQHWPFPQSWPSFFLFIVLIDYLFP